MFVLCCKLIKNTKCLNYLSCFKFIFVTDYRIWLATLKYLSVCKYVNLQNKNVGLMSVGKSLLRPQCSNKYMLTRWQLGNTRTMSQPTEVKLRGRQTVYGVTGWGDRRSWINNTCDCCTLLRMKSPVLQNITIIYDYFRQQIIDGSEPYR